jgi:hypothetical protein
MVISENRKIPEAVGEVISILKPLYGDLEAAQFGHSFQAKRRVNERVSHARGHSPTTYAALTEIPDEFSITRQESSIYWLLKVILTLMVNMRALS